jgi:16S rRNA (adenine1518-N6/adenine1519-N6)-dimethyltransferase
MKRLGQSFLVDSEIIRKIIDCAEPKQEDTVLEIGAGHGELTQPIAKIAGKVVAVEVDRKFCKNLRTKFARFENVQVVQGDFLKTDIRSIFALEGEVSGKVKVIGNLPYYITTPILMKLFREKELFSQLIIMVQREVADRMAAHPGSRTYGALSLSVSYHTEIKKVIDVPKECFRPQPEVDSALTNMRIRRKPPVLVRNEDIFFSFTRAIFGGRRKTLRNALIRAASIDREKAEKLLLSVGIDPGTRAENIGLEQFARLFNAVSRKDM